MRDNPLHVRVAGPDPQQREKTFGGIFGAVLAMLQAKGTVLGAFLEGELVGVCAFVPPGNCQPSTGEKLRLLRVVVAHSSLGASLKVKRWMDLWAQHDPQDKPHWHIGPLAVDPAWRRRGIGSALLQVACDKIDAQNGIAYLETDSDANLPLYERFAFKTVGGADVIGVPNWFLQRAARGDIARWARPPTAPQFVVAKSAGPKPGPASAPPRSGPPTKS
jgi:GNAT superfamily N-acetyltransferase